MTIIDAIIQGVVQGLTEFLPVSSSGHLAITQHITGVAGESNLFFNVMLHVGTLVAVAAFYHKLFWSLIKEFFRMLRDIFTGKFKWREMNYERNLIVMLIIALLPLFIMFLPVPGTDMKVKDLADIFSGAQILLVTALSLLLTSILLAVGARCNKKNSTASFKHMKGSSAETKGRENYTVLDAVCVEGARLYLRPRHPVHSGGGAAGGQGRHQGGRSGGTPCYPRRRRRGGSGGLSVYSAVQVVPQNRQDDTLHRLHSPRGRGSDSGFRC